MIPQRRGNRMSLNSLRCIEKEPFISYILILWSASLTRWWLLPLTLLAFVVKISDVYGCGLINLCSELMPHTISLPIDPRVLRGRAVAKVWRCGTGGGNRPWPNCLFFVSWSYWQLPLSQPSSLQQNEQEPANCNGLFIISNQTLSYKQGEAASSQTIREAVSVSLSWDLDSWITTTTPRMLWDLPLHLWVYLAHGPADLSPYLNAITWI